MEKTDRITLRFADGSERTLPIHGITQLQMLGILDEVGVQKWSELTGSDSTLQTIRTAMRVAALALTFPKQETWTVKRIQESFADADQIATVFNKAIALSNLPKAPGSKKPAQNSGAYG